MATKTNDKGFLGETETKKTATPKKATTARKRKARKATTTEQLVGNIKVAIPMNPTQAFRVGLMIGREMGR